MLLPVGAMAQVVCALGPGAASYQPSADQRPSGDAMQVASRVNAAEKAICGANCPVVALLRNSTAPNAALIVNAGHAKLVYAPQFFASVYGSFGDAGILAVIAHELGHALDDSMGAVWVKSSWTPELRADAMGGLHSGEERPEPERSARRAGRTGEISAAWTLRLESAPSSDSVRIYALRRRVEF